jgi:cytoskeletal protein RodZ
MSIGSQFKKARQKKQLSVNDVYQKTRIYPDILSAIEDDDFQKIPNPIYTKSFLKEYARFLGIDAEGILKEYADALSAKEPAREEAPLKQMRPERPKPVIKINREKITRKIAPLFIGLIVIILALLSFKALGAARDRFLSWRADRAEQVKLKKSVEPAKEKLAVQAPVEKPQLKQDAVSIPKSEKLDLSINISDDVWVEIKRDGDIIFKGILKKGTVRNWQADENFEIWTGNASVMEFSLNGRNMGTIGRGVKRGVIIDRQGIRK